MRVVPARDTPRFLSPASIAVLASAVLFVLPRVNAEKDLTDDVPSLDQRTAALKTITRAHGQVVPDFDKLRAAGERDVYNVRHPISIANLDGCVLTNELLTALDAFPELERLVLSGTNFSDVQFASLPWGNLKHLDLAGTKITDAGLSHLAAFQKLETLSLAGTRITGRLLASSLKPLRNLSSIDLTDTKIDDAGLAQLATIPRLTALNLDGTQIGDVGLSHLAHATQLRHLGLRGIRVTDAGLKQLKALTKLTSLDFSDTSITDNGFREISDVGQVRLLNLAHTQVGDGAAAIIGGWTELEMLVLAGTNVSDRGTRLLARLTKLVKLDLADTRITDLALPVVRRFDKLEVLNLANTGVSNAGLAQLESLSSLRQLNLSGTRITDTGLKSLNPLPSLVKVDVSGTSVTPLDLFRALPQTASSTRRILAALDEKTELDFVNQPLTDVIEYLRQRHDIEIQFNRRGIKDAAVFGKPITLQLKGVTLREALEAILKPLDLTVAVRHEVLLIAASPLPEKVSDIPVVPSGERLSAKLAEALMQPTELEFLEQPLTDVVQYLSRKHRIGIELDPESLTKAGIGSDAPVTRGVKGITLKSALELVLDDLDLTCVADGEKLIVRAE